MIQEIKRYMTEDGKEFPTIEQAEDHVKIYDLLSALKHHLEKGLDSETQISHDDDALKSLKDFLCGERAEILNYYKIIDPTIDDRHHIFLAKGGHLTLDVLRQHGCLLQQDGIYSFTKLIETRQLETGEPMIALWEDGVQVATYPPDLLLIWGDHDGTKISLSNGDYSVILPKRTHIVQEQ